jgi:F0F1-type ATP synthase assembly protein I
VYHQLVRKFKPKNVVLRTACRNLVCRRYNDDLKKDLARLHVQQKKNKKKKNKKKKKKEHNIKIWTEFVWLRRELSGTLLCTS